MPWLIAEMDLLKKIKLIFLTIIGLTIFAIGILLLVLPGPGILLILMGLVILSGEFYWARKTLKKIKSNAETIVKKASRGD